MYYFEVGLNKMYLFTYIFFDVFRTDTFQNKMIRKKRSDDDCMVNMNEAIIIRISELCKERELTLMDLATLSGVKQSTLNEIMQGRSKHPRIDTIRKIATGLDMTLSEFFEDEIFYQVTDEPNNQKRKRRKYKFKDYVPHYKKDKENDDNNNDSDSENDNSDN